MSAEEYATRIRESLHRVEHWLHWQRGHPEVVNIDGRYWVGFQCATCGAVTGMEECPEWLQDAPMSEKRK
jgi:hypothetical protein